MEASGGGAGLWWTHKLIYRTVAQNDNMLLLFFVLSAICKTLRHSGKVGREVCGA